MKIEKNLTQLHEYQPSHFSITKTELCFDIHEKKTVVCSELSIVRTGEADTLSLNGESLTLISVALNGEVLSDTDYSVDDAFLVIKQVPDQFTLTIVTELEPSKNSELMGLYQSNDLLCTQCESEGFRRITYYLDRPDVLSTFTVKLTADKDDFPILLSNGNLVEQGNLDNNQHFAVWHDPHPKPCYLFALVAGRLASIESEFITASNKTVKLAIYSEPQNIDQCHHAMESMKKSMRWDEAHYGREYDLDVFNIVAVNDFNAGAMENKGLNVFNAKYILVDPTLATDTDYQLVDTVVAHEYFHNWSGNRVTLRDWFQLSLKEGFTVFREQSFDETVQSKAAHRIERVNQLRAMQFPEDSGPNAHPIRPTSYIKIDNFYTCTVYEKGAEVIRMLATLLGPVIFRKATDEYFSRFDGKAVTTDDFVRVMSEVSGEDLTQFQLWYEQAGTPVLEVSAQYDDPSREYELTFKQTIPDTQGQLNKQPMVIPIKLGLIDGKGVECVLHSDDLVNGDLFVLDRSEKSLVLRDVDADVVPSLLRHFSAPVKLQFAYTEDQLAHLVEFDTDPFARWEAMQRFALSEIFHLMLQVKENKPLSVGPDFVELFRSLLKKPAEDKLYFALLLELPSEAYIAEQLETVDVDSIHLAREFLQAVMAKQCEQELKALFVASHQSGPFAFTKEQVGMRHLKNTLLTYLALLNEATGVQMAVNQFKASLGENMTDCLAALSCLVHGDTLDRVEALSAFEEHYQEHPLVMNKWLSIQAGSKLKGALDSVKSLMNHPSFSLNNPNNVYALLLAFTRNRVHFHRGDGLSYQFIAEQVILLDQTNPMVAARLVEPLTQWRRFDRARQSLMQSQLQRILTTKPLSKNVCELVEKSLPK
jgi:aminopeptidase N